MRLFTIQEVDKFFEEELELEPEILPDISWGLSISGWFLLPPSDMFFSAVFYLLWLLIPPTAFVWFLLYLLLFDEIFQFSCM